MRRIVLASLATALIAAAPAAAQAAETAIVIKDRTSLRAAPRDSAQQQAVLWQGEAVEIRGERLDYLQVYDYRRERGGFVHASQIRRMKLTAEEAPEVLAIARFIRDTPGAEALGIGYVAAYIQAAPAEVLRSPAGIEALDALGTFADRLAHRASSGTAQARTGETTLTAHLDVAARYGVRLTNHERSGRMQICYEGDAFRRVLALPSSPEQRARAVLALTRPECVDPDGSVVERNRINEWRAEVLDGVDASALPGYLKNRVLLRRASTWSALAFQKARNGTPADAAANRALSDLAGIDKSELTDDDLAPYNDAAMRVNASRWAALPAATNSRRLQIVTAPGNPGETCVALVDAKNEGAAPLARRCTYGIVWTSSATLNREGNALALAVQTMEAWREMWIFRKTADGWTVRVLPPAATMPEVGYVEFAGWVPGGAEILVAREARGEGKYRRSFEVLRLDTLAVARQAGDPEILGPFQRWQDPAWKRLTLSVR
ncbi:MAG TPA: hypothetical protein VFC14_21795 [Burkholderiales bacterium]|nr:hypothetical protein [Burkholderiales bacterium]